MNFRNFRYHLYFVQLDFQNKINRYIFIQILSAKFIFYGFKTNFVENYIFQMQLKWMFERSGISGWVSR